VYVKGELRGSEHFGHIVRADAVPYGVKDKL